MLVLTRRVGESIRINGDTFVSVLKINGSQIKLGVSAPPEVPVVRTEAIRCGATDDTELEASDDESPSA